jgi:hypothetical protein
MEDKDCCTYNCEQGKHCPVRATRRVRAGQPAPPIMLDLEDIEDDQAPLSDAIAGLAVLVIILIVGACAALVVGLI